MAETPDNIEDLDGHNAVFEERDSEAWYLDRVDICTRVAESAVKEGRPWEAAENAMLIGEYLTELRLKFDFDEYVKQAKKAEENRLAANKTRRKDSPKSRFEQVVALTAKGQSLRNACRIVAKREDSHPSTIQHDYYKHKNRPKPMD